MWRATSVDLAVGEESCQNKIYKEKKSGGCGNEEEEKPEAYKPRPFTIGSGNDGTTPMKIHLALAHHWKTLGRERKRHSAGPYFPKKMSKDHKHSRKEQRERIGESGRNIMQGQ
jgi:hypothetical protein